MEMSGERLIAAPRARVWEALNDPKVLEATIPGCKELSKTSDTTFEATVVQKVGPVKATFKGAVELSDIVPGESYRIDGEGKGGVAGFANGGADIRLTDVEGGTLLSYAVDAKVGGKLAQIGSRLIDSFASKLSEDFFTRFQEQVEGPKEDTAPEAVETEVSEGADEPQEKKNWFRRLVG